MTDLDTQYRKEGKYPDIHFLPLSEPIAPRLDNMLEPSKLNVPLDEPISPHLEELLGRADTN